MMASLRFAARAFATEGKGPAQILARLDQLVDLERDGQFATVVCARLMLETGRLTMASAGHPDVLIADSRGVRFAGIRPGPPVGLQRRAPKETSVTLRSPATLLAFTDGLFERRGESPDVGMARVRDAVDGLDGPLGGLVDALTNTVVPPHQRDDVAMVALRWTASTRARARSA
jgi:serine phosphatase RsbU (regulator of sigma subunit)